MISRTPSNLVNLEPTDSCGVGFIASIRGESSHRILRFGLTSLANVTHRGAIGSDGKTGDGAGVTTSVPNGLVRRWLRDLGVMSIPERIGLGVIFLPRPELTYQASLKIVVNQIKSIGLRVMAIRQVPVDHSQLGAEAAKRCPRILQVFIDSRSNDADEFERELFLARRAIELTPQQPGMEHLYVASMSCRTISYKAMVQSANLDQFYPDLQNSEYEPSYCIYHQRFSTNTAPEWSLCQPFRMLAHNGEINTIRGNRNWMTAREAAFYHPYWGRHRHHLRKLFRFNDSDSATLDNTLELLTLSGRTPLHVMSMLIPPAWQNDPRVGKAEAAFYDYHSSFCEPWDGPAAVAFTDGKFIGACLDRNGLRPARYKLTQDGILSLGSEVGADRLDDQQVIRKGRLGPGEMIAVDLENHELLLDDDIKRHLANQQPYQEWLENGRFSLPAPSDRETWQSEPTETFKRKQIAAGLHREEVDIGITSMARDGREPTFSMGVDTPLAVLSQQPRHLADYFKQRFAQVTNPPIDPIRERLVMSVGAGLGPERNILIESPNQCRILQLDNPILLPGETHQLQRQSEYEIHRINCTWLRSEGIDGLKPALSKIVEQAQLAADRNVSIILLSDLAADSEHVAIPMLMVVGAVHHALCKSGQRMMCSLVAQTSSVRDPHQLALLFGYGCTAVYPYLAFGTIDALKQNGKLGDDSLETLFERYRDALTKGLLKILSKMGISVLNSYQGAQIFEAVGLGPELIETCFKYSYSNIGGIGFDDVARDCLRQHDAAYDSPSDELEIADPGFSKPRRAGEHHVINGKVTKNIHQFVRENNGKKYELYLEEVQPQNPVAIRDLLELVPAESGSIPLEEVESIEAIRERFTTAAMSLGAISPEAHEAIALAMNEIGGKSNSGEGGEDAARYHLNADGKSANSKIKQIASGRFGVTAHYLVNAEEIEIKMAQGAKPGEGGQLPGFKVNDLIARLRSTDVGVTLISPPPHHDIYSIEDLAQLIHDIKMVNPGARVCVKLVAKTGVGGIAIGVAKSKADTILISGHEGGTGASPLTSIKHAGLPWELGLAETHQSLLASGLRDRVVLRSDGGLRTGKDIIHAAILGAEEFNFGTMALIALGCVYVKKCHLNNCPVGIATQDPKYRSKFKGEPENLVNYLNAVASECRQWLARLGVRTLDELVGQTQFLKVVTNPGNPKTRNLDLSPLLSVPDAPAIRRTPTHEKYTTPVTPASAFDDEIIEQLENEHKTEFHRQIVNTDRNIGTRLAGKISQQFGAGGQSEQTIHLKLEGTSGQSLGAFLCNGISIEVAGEANDYVGKGMSGGEIILRPPANALFESFENVIAGNTLLYGATGGKLFAAGLVAERLAVRNSGAIAVVEGCGDHGCEYMTRGTVVVLGPVGNNFAAGMTGGQSFVYDPDDELEPLLSRDSAESQLPTELEFEPLRKLIVEFQQKTGSSRAAEILSRWDESRHQFKWVLPISAPVSTAKPASAPSA